MSRWWQFAQLSAKYKDQNALDQIPQAGKLFIGGLRALDQPHLLEAAGITHILSILDFDYHGSEELKRYQRLLIHAEDYPGENLLQHFPTTNAFIKDALKERGSALVHCAMGVSRSATVICAYLMHAQGLSAASALELLRQARPTCAPNPGFLRQLDVYQEMQAAGSETDAKRIYNDWNQRRWQNPKM